jgi:hypothetical protein
MYGMGISPRKPNGADIEVRGIQFILKEKASRK